MDLQKRHYDIVDNPIIPIPIKQNSLVELHRLSITLSNLYDVAPSIIGVGKDASISITQETRTSTKEFIG